MVEDTIISCTKFNPSSMVPELNVEIEEADLRLFPHAKYAVENGGKRIVVLGNDTDIIVGFIYHCQYLKDIGLRSYGSEEEMPKQLDTFLFIFLLSSYGHPYVNNYLLCIA